ncbi:hypothetical protein BV378_14250 [Nostoc sp. RF31YmG]|nr:hypothetical protein BV378_14250 [Nostoc sp. RF31YmG]
MTDLIVKAHEFAEAGVVHVAPGQTLAAMLAQATGGVELSPDLVVRVGGHEVPAALWDRVRPKPGSRIVVTRTGLAGGGSARQLLAAAVMIVVSIYAPGWGQAAASAAGWGTAAGQAISAGIVIAASYAVNALIRVPTAANASSTDQKQWNQLTGSSNQINPWGVVPLVVGEHRYFPPHAAMPYSEMVGRNSYQHCMFDLGYGLLYVDQLKIGDDPLSNFTGWDWELSDEDTPATLYTNDVSEDSVSSAMNEDGDQVTRTTAPNVGSIGLDILLPQGLKVFAESMAKGWPMWIVWKVEYRAVGSGTWLTPTSPRLSGLVSSWVAGGSELPAFGPAAGLFLIKDQTRDPFSVGLSWDVPSGQYEVRLTRYATKAQTSRTWADAATWLALRSIRYTSPSSTGTCKLNLRIRATEQLTGTLQTFSCMVKQTIQVYNRTTGAWSWQYSVNPAWNAYWLMTTCRAVARRVPASRIDLQSFADFADFCTTHGLECRMVVDTQMTVMDLLRKVLAGSLGDLGNRDGKYCVVFDRDDPTPVMVFTAEETEGFRATRTFTRVPHALRVQFKNPDANWQDDEIVVVRDGYSYRGKDARGNASSAPTATEFETLNLEQTCRARQAWQVARYHFAQALFRPNTYQWTSDIAGLSVARGDCVQVPNDVTEWGAGYGRVRAITVGGMPGAGATITLDNDVTTVDGTAYRMQFRRAGGGLAVANVVAAGGETRVFAIDALPAGVGVGDMAVLGETQTEVHTLIVTGVRYTEDLGTEFTATDYDARVTPYWANPPASIISEVTGTDYDLPDPPVVTVVTSSAANDSTDDAGVSAPVVRVGVSVKSGVLRLQAQ